MTLPKSERAAAPRRLYQRHYRRLGMAGMVMAGSLSTAGCVTVNAPSEPIVIELNINITQEVIYRLAADAGNTIEENADIF